MISKQYKGQKYDFEIGKKVGSGGNGIVYDAKCKTKNLNYCVIKIFNKKTSTKYKEERYKRFKKEIHTVLNIQKEYDGIIKIYDYYYDLNYTKNVEAWYVMEKADQYYVTYSKTLKEKLIKLRELAEIIRFLHNHPKQYAHRDIKPENIFIINNKIKLSDFGLVWCNENDERLTLNGEKIGPYRILPPELENVILDDHNIIDYRKSDVYLFGKVLWMYIKNNNYGFFGEYSRNDINKYIDKKEYKNIITFEPIHKLLEGATKKDLNERISIEQCIEYISKEIEIINQRVGKKAIDRLIYMEETKSVLAKYQPTSLSFENINDIKNILNKIASVSEVYIENFNKHRVININNDDIRIENSYIVISENLFNIRREIYLIPDVLEINNKTLNNCLSIKNDSENILNKYPLYSLESPIPQKEAKINSQFKIIFKIKNTNEEKII